MNVPSDPTLIARQLRARVRQLHARGPVLAASLVTIRKRCGKPGCHCNTGPGHQGHYLTRKEANKTRTVYVPREMVEEVRAWIDEHRRLKTLLSQISALALARVRTHVRTRSSRAAKS